MKNGLQPARSEVGTGALRLLRSATNTHKVRHDNCQLLTSVKKILSWEFRKCICHSYIYFETDVSIKVRIADENILQATLHRRRQDIQAGVNSSSKDGETVGKDSVLKLEEQHWKERTSDGDEPASQMQEREKARGERENIRPIAKMLNKM